MTREELIERLKGFEWNDLECKRARSEVPQDAYRTVSAFANTAGGWLIFGVRETAKGMEIAGVEDVDKVQNNFLSALRSGGPIPQSIDVKAEKHTIDGKNILAFYIPESPRQDKPVCLQGNLSKAYIRRGGGDERCTHREIQRFLRDANPQPFDSEPLTDFDAEAFSDERTLAWYRRRFNEREPGRYETLSDQDFLIESGFLTETRQGLKPIRAAVLLFGKARFVQRILHRPVVDMQLIHAPFDEPDNDQRWADRIVVEDNILLAWLAIVERYMKYADRPFSLNGTTLRRHDEPPDYISFREAAINLLIHQDYGDFYRHARLQIFHDRTVFWNPGDAFASLDQLLESGGKELRNPTIVTAFRRIGLSDQAGTGIRAIYGNWRQLGFVPPKMDNQSSEKTFEITLLKEPILSENQKRFQEDHGVRLSNLEADVFAFACRENRFTLTDVRAIGGLNVAAARALIDRLVVQQLIEPLDAENSYALAPAFREAYQKSLSRGEDVSGAPKGEDTYVQGPSRDQVGTKSGPSSEQVRILENMQLEQSLTELMALVGRTNRTKFRDQVLKPLLNAGWVEMTIPDKPRSSKQKYRLTGSGRNAVTTFKR